MSMLNNMPDKCTIAIRSLTKETAGGLGVSVSVYKTISANVACWVQPSASREVRGFKKKEFKDVRNIYFTEDPDVTSANVVYITVRNGVAVPTSDQIILDVIGFPKPDSSAGFGIVWRISAASISGRTFSVADVNVI